jgi:hypothetical protein
MTSLRDWTSGLPGSNTRIQHPHRFVGGFKGFVEKSRDTNYSRTSVCSDNVVVLVGPHHPIIIKHSAACNNQSCFHGQS